MVVLLRVLRVRVGRGRGVLRQGHLRRRVVWTIVRILV